MKTFKDFSKVVKLTQVTCPLMKNSKLFLKWSNCLKRPACRWKIQRFLWNSQIVPNDLSVGEKYKDSLKWSNCLGNLPIDEKFKDFSKMVKLSQATCLSMKNTKIFLDNHFREWITWWDSLLENDKLKGICWV
jgi:hypothetical protein